MSSLDTLLEDIQKNKYAATNEQVSQLAIAVAAGRRADGTYLRVLLVRSIKLLAGDLTPLQAVNKAHEVLYAAVVKGVTEPDMKPAEVRRRAGFARSSVSTLRGYVKARGKLQDLNIEKVSKLMLRRASLPDVPKDESRPASAARKAEGQLIRSLGKLLRKDPVTARRLAEAVIAELSKLLRSGGSLRKAA